MLYDRCILLYYIATPREDKQPNKFKRSSAFYFPEPKLKKPKIGVLLFASLLNSLLLVKLRLYHTFFLS